MPTTTNTSLRTTPLWLEYQHCLLGLVEGSCKTSDSYVTLCNIPSRYSSLFVHVLTVGLRGRALPHSQVHKNALMDDLPGVAIASAASPAQAKSVVSWNRWCTEQADSVIVEGDQNGRASPALSKLHASAQICVRGKLKRT